MHLFTNVDPNPDDASIEEGDASMAHFIPLQSILPVGSWPKLTHFVLSRFIVSQSDLMGFLKLLPATIRTIELRSLYFLEGQGNNSGLLEQIRDDLDWGTRPAWERPRLSISIERN